jgi:phage baseplate assembly protein W
VVAAVDEVPHLRWPLRGAAHRLQTVEQDTIDDVRQCVRVLLVTPLGARPLAPEIGVEDPTFTAGVDAEVLAAELEEMEDRASVTVIADQVDPQGHQDIRIHVELADAGESEG